MILQYAQLTHHPRAFRAMTGLTVCARTMARRSSGTRCGMRRIVDLPPSVPGPTTDLVVLK